MIAERAFVHGSPAPVALDSAKTSLTASLAGMTEPGRTSRRLGNIARLSLRHPTWLREVVRVRLRTIAERDREFNIRDHARYLRTAEAAVIDAYGIERAEYEALAAQVRMPPRPTESTWSAGDDLAAVIGAIILLRRPETVVETGVAMGFTTAVILAALADNGRGHLHSIDMPPLQVDARSFIGQAVPEEMRDRWSLHVGPSRSLLPRLAAAVAPIDVFVHDADHTYAGQYEEFHEVWPHIPAGGVLISDDVANHAFLDFAAHVGGNPYLVGRLDQRAAVGLLRKS